MITLPPVTPRVVAALLLACLLPATASAQTVAHWRFEGDQFLADSSGNDHTLALFNSVEQTVLPATGAGSAFPNPIPQTGSANLSAAHKTAFGLTTNETARTYLRAADSAAFTTNTLTLEAMIHFDARTGNLVFVAGHFTSTGNQRSYALLVNNTTNRLGFTLSAEGNSGTTLYSDSADFAIVNGRDYYLAMTVDLTSGNQADRSVTLFLQDLTNAGALVSQTFSNIAESSLFNANSGFGVGAQGNGNTSETWRGLIDEVRLSNVVLASDQLLVAIPEPSAFAALAGLAVLGLAATRRRRR